MYTNLFVLFQLIFGICCFNDQKIGDKPVNIDSLWTKWNVITLESLNNQINKAKNEKEKFMYENRKSAFKTFMSIPNNGKTNTNSIRFQFLKTIYDKRTLVNDFFVVEANQSGERMEIRSFLILTNKNKLDSAVFYSFDDGRWKEMSSKSLSSIYNGREKLDLKRTTYGEGFNNDDIIVSHFDKENIKSSEFYLFGTILKNNQMEKLLEWITN